MLHLQVHMEREGEQILSHCYEKLASQLVSVCILLVVNIPPFENH